MQQRTFLSNAHLIKQATKGKSIDSRLGTRSTACEDYTLEQKQIRALKKLQDLEDKFNFERGELKNYRRIIKSFDKEELIVFLELKINTMLDLNEFFLKQRTDH